MKLTVVICTYHPKIEILIRVLRALQNQTLPLTQWQLLVVDNCSPVSVEELIDLSWHPNAKVIVATTAGLSHARVAGVQQSQANLIVFADDDNVLDKNYLESSYAFHIQHPRVGCYGGRSLPVFESQPPDWFLQTGINLGCQDYGEELYVSNYAAVNFRLQHYPEKAPIGTGMVILKEAFLAYKAEAASNPERMKLGRRGKSLSSGEDNDIILTLVKEGYEIAYVPGLVVHHLIPANRYSQKYLEKMAFESNRTWVKVLHIHGIHPFPKIQPWTKFPRKLKSYFAHRAWQSPLSAIRWSSSCGIFEGCAEI